MTLTAEQKENLKGAIKEYYSANAKYEAAHKLLNEKQQKMKMCCQSNSTNGPAILSDALVILGQAYMEIEA